MLLIVCAGFGREGEQVGGEGNVGPGGEAGPFARGGCGAGLFKMAQKQQRGPFEL